MLEDWQSLIDTLPFKWLAKFFCGHGVRRAPDLYSKILFFYSVCVCPQIGWNFWLHAGTGTMEASISIDKFCFT